MPTMQVTLEESCVHLAQYQESIQGYVRFSDISKTLKVSRQLCDLAFKRAVRDKLITEQQLKRWKASYKSRTVRAEFALLRTHEAWLKSEAAVQDISRHDLLNRVLNDYIHNQTHANDHP